MVESSEVAVSDNHGTPSVADIEENSTTILQTPTSESQLRSSKHVVASSSNNQPLDTRDYNSFPKLCSVQTMVNQLDRKLVRDTPRDLEIDARITRLETHQNQIIKMMQPFVVNKIQTIAREILKWAIGAKNKKFGYSRQDYYRTPEVKRHLMLACRAYGLYGMHPNQESIEAFKALVQSIITENNDIGYVDTIEELQEMVKACVDSFNIFPNLLTKYPNQCQIIIQFGSFKKYLPEEFRTLKDQ